MVERHGLANYCLATTQCNTITASDLASWRLGEGGHFTRGLFETASDGSNICAGNTAVKIEVHRKVIWGDFIFQEKYNLYKIIVMMEQTFGNIEKQLKLKKTT